MEVMHATAYLLRKHFHQLRNHTTNRRKCQISLSSNIQAMKTASFKALTATGPISH